MSYEERRYERGAAINHAIATAAIWLLGAWVCFWVGVLLAGLISTF